MKNASYLAYPPVVAAGKNATTIHYVNNSQIVSDGEMVLMDAGNYNYLMILFWNFIYLLIVLKNVHNFKNGKVTHNVF